MLIGITGGIGTGKSYIAKILNSKGYKVIHSDLITRQLLKKGEINYNLVVAEFGTEILDDSGEINRSKLREIILENEGKRRKLNSLTHPNIMKEIENEAMESNGKRIVFVELPLLFEENLEGFFDDIWLVDTSIDKQIERISIRDGISKDDALKIIEKQLSREEKLKRCSKVINNENEDMKNLELQIDALLEKVGFNGK